jgi:uncharacterized protein YndB with AHSA1/START domain
LDKTRTETPTAVAENEILIAAPRDRVFAILADPQRYAEWVVGASRIRDADESWPAPGSRLHHSVGAEPVTLNDSTEVVECRAPERLVLLARLGALGSFRIELVLHDEGAATQVTMREVAVEGFSKLAEPVTGAAVAVRNKVSLGRLKELAES